MIITQFSMYNSNTIILMNPQQSPTSPSDPLRWCDRYKSTLVYTHIEAFAKKIRKKKNFDSMPINANAEQREIDVFYKEGWEYEHAHSSLACDISDPIYVQEMPDGEEGLGRYYQRCKQFIERLKTEHEDETAFRIQARYILPSTPIPPAQMHSPVHSPTIRKHFQNLTCSREMYYNFILTMEQAIKSMVANVQKSAAMDEGGMEEEGCGYQRVAELYQVLGGWVQGLKGDYVGGDMGEWLRQEHPEEITSMVKYMGNFIGLMQQMRQTKSSCLYNYQPRISVLTHLIHPVLLSIGALLHKEQISWQNQYEHNPFNIDYSQPIPQGHLLQDKPHHELSRVIFINFDGYQSEFNIEMARNFGEHLLYVSFPVFGGQGEGVGDEGRGLRFYKKIMWNTCREMYEYQNEDYDVVESVNNLSVQGMGDPEQMDMEELNIRKKLQLHYNPQKYFQQITKIYTNPSTPQSPKNLYILPINFPYLQSQHTPLFQTTSTASPNPSHFILHLMQAFLYDSFRKFNPTHIVVSYSGQGRLAILDEHWVGLLQELAGIGRRRVMMVGNFTAGAAWGLRDQYAYDGFVDLGVGQGEAMCTADVMRKMTQFLKITSGTYNLERPQLPEPVIPRYKLAKLNAYIRGLLAALSAQQYPYLKNRVSELFLRVDSIVLNRSLDENKKELKNSIPQYYQDLFRHLKAILLKESNKFPSYLAREVQKLRAEVVEIGRGLGPGVQGRERCVDQMIRELELAIASEKVAEVAYVYLKVQPDRIEYEELKQEIKEDDQLSDPLKMPTKINNNLQDLYCLSLRYTAPTKQKQALPITPTTQLLYRQNQIYKFRRAGKKTANILYMNGLKNGQFQCYAGLVTLNAGQGDRNKNKICSQRVEMLPIVFNGMGALDYGTFAVRTNWNYAETNRYYFLYWPTEYNLLQAKLHELSNQIYQPRLLAQIYISEIPEGKQHRLVFNRANLSDNAIPRRNCTALQLIDSDKIFILGGFYEKEFNYLSLQTEITGLDLEHYDGQGRKCMVTNEKGVLYELDEERKGAKNKNNSYIRARREYQIFQLEQLCSLSEPQLQAQHEHKSFILLGGYGQNFTRPFSLLSYNYYELKINMQTKAISSIERKMIYEKLLTANLKGFVKNSGFFERLAVYEKGVLKPNQRLGPEIYVGHRSVFCLIREDRDGMASEELMMKTKYLFAIDLYSIKPQYQKLAIRIGQQRDSKTNQSSQFLLSLSNQGNHYLQILTQNSPPETIQIYLEKPSPKSTFQTVPLTHGSILAIDIKFKQVYVVVRHDLYTAGKCVLAQCEIPSQQAEAVLKVAREFEENLEQYFIFVPRPTEVLFLHGVTFSNVSIGDFSYRVGKKEGSKEQGRKKIAAPNFIDPKKYKKCFTVMIKDQNKQTKTLQIQQISLLLPFESRPQSYTLRRYRLKLSQPNPDFTWSQTLETPLQLIDESTNNPVHILRIESTRLLQIEPDSQMLFYSFTSPLLASLWGVDGGIVVVRVYGFNRRWYLLVFRDGGIKAEGRMTVVNAELGDARRVWELAMPIQQHMKSLNKYKDMGIM